MEKMTTMDDLTRKSVAKRKQGDKCVVTRVVLRRVACWTVIAILVGVAIRMNVMISKLTTAVALIPTSNAAADAASFTVSTSSPTPPRAAPLSSPRLRATPASLGAPMTTGAVLPPAPVVARPTKAAPAKAAPAKLGAAKVLLRGAPPAAMLGRPMDPQQMAPPRVGVLNIGAASRGASFSNGAAHIDFGNKRFLSDPNKRHLTGIEHHLGLAVIVENILGSKVDLEDELVPARELPAAWSKWATSAKFVEWAGKPRPGWNFNHRSHTRCPSNGYENPLHKYKKGPMMTIPEIVLMLRQLKEGYNVVEFGAGMSTLAYAFCVGESGSWTAVEGHLEWCTELRGLLPPNVRAHCAPLPQNPRLANGGPRGTYSLAQIAQMTPHTNALDGMCYDKQLDVVLDDGDARSRISREILPYLHEKSVLIIHDTWNINQVGPAQIESGILPNYDLVAIAGPGLSVFRPKPEAIATAKANALAGGFAWGCAERNSQLWECAVPISAGGTASCIAWSKAVYPPTTTNPAACAALCAADGSCVAFQIEYGGAGLCTLIAKTGFTANTIAGSRGSHAELRT